VAWYSEWFGRQYLEIYSYRDQEEAARDIDKVEKIIDLPRELPILDLACGSGRHALELAARGYSVVGLDLSDTLLGVARGSAAGDGLCVSFVRGDKRALPFSRAFGCVLNFFTSFGYFDDEDENLSVLVGMRESLLPGGSFLVDHLNRDYVLSNLVPEDYSDRNGKKIVQRRRFDESSSRVEKEITVYDGASEKTYRESVRLYGPDELSSMVERAGLRVTSILGGLDGSGFAAGSARMVVIGEHPYDSV
jgi:SAM-dependent methyltransferase